MVLQDFEYSRAQYIYQLEAPFIWKKAENCYSLGDFSRGTRSYLDEATSALGSVAEKYTQDSLEKFMQDRTTIVIAHRLSMLSRRKDCGRGFTPSGGRFAPA